MLYIFWCVRSCTMDGEGYLCTQNGFTKKLFGLKQRRNFEIRECFPIYRIYLYFVAPLAISAPNNDIKFFKKLKEWETIEKTVFRVQAGLNGMPMTIQWWESSATVQGLGAGIFGIPGLLQ